MNLAVVVVSADFGDFGEGRSGETCGDNMQDLFFRSEILRFVLGNPTLFGWECAGRCPA